MRVSTLGPMLGLRNRRQRAKFFSSFRVVTIVACFTFAIAFYGRQQDDFVDDATPLGASHRRHLLQTVDNETGDYTADNSTSDNSTVT